LQPERELTITAATQVPGLLAFPPTREGPALGPGREPRPASVGQRVLVAGVGYTCLGDLSVGPVLAERLAARAWPDGVVVEDLSYGPIDVLFKLQASAPFAAGIFATAVARGRTPGTLHGGPWSAPRLSADELQARVAEAITGVISLDNLLCILDHFDALPPRVVVLEVEPVVETWGTEFSPPVAAALEAAEVAIRAEVGRLVGPEPAA
jgi:hydrogenase maturation protease